MWEENHISGSTGLFNPSKQALLFSHLESLAPVPTGWLNGNLSQFGLSSLASAHTELRVQMTFFLFSPLCPPTPCLALLSFCGLCTCVCIGVCPSSHVWRLKEDVSCPLCDSQFHSLETESFTEPNTRGLFLFLNMGSGGSYPGSQACTASPLSPLSHLTSPFSLLFFLLFPLLGS